MDRSVRIARELLRIARGLATAAYKSPWQGKLDEFYKVIKSVLPVAYRIMPLEVTSIDWRWTVKRPCVIDGKEIDSALRGQKGIVFDFRYDPYSHNDDIYEIIDYTGVDNLKRLGISWLDDMPKAATLKDFEEKAKAFFTKLENSIAANSGAKSKKDQVLNDLKDTFGVPVEDVELGSYGARITVAGKAYGDGYDFYERYENGTCTSNECSNGSTAPIFKKEAKYLYDTYGISTIVISGYYD